MIHPDRMRRELFVHLIRRRGPRPAGPLGREKASGATTSLGCNASIKKAAVNSLKSSISNWEKEKRTRYADEVKFC